MNDKKEDVDILKDINNQFKDLIELIENENDSKFSMKVFNQLKKQNRSYSKKKFFIILLLLFTSIYFILSIDNLSYNIYFVCLSFIRLLLIKIHPYWDWTTIYTSNCLINNPFYNNSLELSECKKCADTSEILRQSNITFFNFTKNIYINHLPVIVDDATQTWLAMKELTVPKLFELFAEDTTLAKQDLCFFQSNIRSYNQIGGADKLFNDYLDGKRRSFIVHWNNCKRESLKIIRSYYSKPYFLPSSVSQTLMGNWFLVSSGMDKDKKRLHAIPLNYNWIWIASIQGSCLIELRPKPQCENICSILKAVKLNKGDLIIYSRLYDAFYTPLNRETILLAQGVD